MWGVLGGEQMEGEGPTRRVQRGTDPDHGASFAGPAVAALVIGTLVVDILGPILLLPVWLQQLALSNHVGEPMLGTWDLGGLVACLVLAVGGLALGAWGLRRRDVSA